MSGLKIIPFGRRKADSVVADTHLAEARCQEARPAFRDIFLKYGSDISDSWDSPFFSDIFGLKEYMRAQIRILILTESRIKLIIIRLISGCSAVGSAHGSGALTHLSTIPLQTAVTP